MGRGREQDARDEVQNVFDHLAQWIVRCENVAEKRATIEALADHVALIIMRRNNRPEPVIADGYLCVWTPLPMGRGFCSVRKVEEAVTIEDVALLRAAKQLESSASA